MRTAVIVAGIGLALVGLGIGWARLERWWTGRDQRHRRRSDLAERGARDYLRATSGPMTEAQRRAIQEAQARSAKREG